MDFTIVLKPAWVSLILLFCLLQQSDQTSQNGIEESIKNLHNLILGKWEDLEYKISSMDDRLRQVDTLIKNDIKPKLESMEVKVNKMEIEVATIGLSSTTQSPMLIEIKQKVENIENELSTCGQSPSLHDALEGPINELKSQGNSIHAAINTLTSNNLAMSTKIDNIGNEVKKSIDSIQFPYEQLNQVSKAYSSTVDNITSQIRDELDRGFATVTGPLKALNSQGNLTLNEIENMVNSVSKLYSSALDNQTSQISNEFKTGFATVTGQLKALKSQENECTPGNPKSSLPWHTVGREDFVRFTEGMTWPLARTLCQSNCMDLFKPDDAVQVAKYLDEKFSTSWHWIAGRGDGSRQVWVTTGEAINKTEPWYGSNYNNVGTEHCLAVLTHGSYPEARTVLDTESCTSNWPVLCG